MTEDAMTYDPDAENDRESHSLYSPDSPPLGQPNPDERDLLEATLDLFITDYDNHFALKPDHLIPASCGTTSQ